MKNTGFSVDFLRGVCVASLLLCHTMMPDCPQMLLVLHAAILCILEGAREDEEKDLRAVFVRVMKPYIIACCAMAVLDAANQILVYRDLSTEAFTRSIYSALLAGFAGAERMSELVGVPVDTGIPIMWILPLLFLARLINACILRVCKPGLIRTSAAFAVAAAGLLSLSFVNIPFAAQYAMAGAGFVMIGNRLKGFAFCRGTAFERGALADVLSFLGESMTVLLAAYGAFAYSFEWIGLFSVRFVFSLAIAWLARTRCVKKSSAEGRVQSIRRDPTADIMKGILICLMILGHEQMDEGLRAVVYSVHMMAFVFLSGCFYKGAKQGEFVRQLSRMLCSVLVPYSVFGILYVIICTNGLSKEIESWVLGISLAGKLFTDVAWIGPVYFVLLLLGTRIVYMALDHVIDRESVKTGSVVLLSLVGVWLGREKYWLPWSFDCALYSLIFYHAGYLCKRHGILERVWEKPWITFALCCVWAAMIADGSMEIFVRDYGRYALVVAGSVCGIIICWMGCRAVSVYPIINRTMGVIGRNTIYVLWMHTLFFDRIKDLMYTYFDISRTGMLSFAAGLCVQVAGGLAIGFLAECIGRVRQGMKT